MRKVLFGLLFGLVSCLSVQESVIATVSAEEETHSKGVALPPFHDWDIMQNLEKESTTFIISSAATSLGRSSLSDKVTVLPSPFGPLRFDLNSSRSATPCDETMKVATKFNRYSKKKYNHHSKKSPESHHDHCKHICPTGPTGANGLTGAKGAKGATGPAGPSFNTFAFSTNLAGAYGGNIAMLSSNTFLFADISNINYDGINNQFVIVDAGTYQINTTFAIGPDSSSGAYQLLVNGTEAGRDIFLSSGAGGVTVIVPLNTGDTIALSAAEDTLHLNSAADITLTILRIN